MSDTLPADSWIALIVGNTRLHWGLFEQQTLISVSHTPHLASASNRVARQTIGTLVGEKGACDRTPKSLWIASVVPTQTALCLQAFTAGGLACYELTCYEVERSHIPIHNLYATLGIDRAINLLGAQTQVGWPALVIDAGTALTFTAGYQAAGYQTASYQTADWHTNSAASTSLYGGAILPGLRLQATSLGIGTASLEAFTTQSQSLLHQAHLPTRWANDTDGAIASGIVYGAIATITDTLADWWQRFPQGKGVLTGGDGPLLHRFLQQKTPELASRVSLNPDLMFYGLSRYRQTRLAAVSEAE